MNVTASMSEPLNATENEALNDAKPWTDGVYSAATMILSVKLITNMYITGHMQEEYVSRGQYTIMYLWN